MDRHVPAGKIDHARPGSKVGFVEWGMEGRGSNIVHGGGSGSQGNCANDSTVLKESTSADGADISPRGYDFLPVDVDMDRQAGGLKNLSGNVFAPAGVMA